ncbi:hypothetical protein ACLMJK_006497 [Lecanora helva]
MLTWAFFLLVRHPKALEKVLEEMKANNIDLTTITRRELQKMTYLQNVLRETIQLYPPVPISERVANRSTTLATGEGPNRAAPILVPKGTTVTYSVYARHRRPDLYGMDAEKLRPDRWDEHMPLHNEKMNAAWGYLPFNGGPRIYLRSWYSSDYNIEKALTRSLAADFALTEAAYVLARILSHFPQIRLPANSKVELTGVEKQTVTLVLSSTEGCMVDLTARN